MTPLEPISQNALRYYNDVAYDGSYNGIATEVEEGERIARAHGIEDTTGREPPTRRSVRVLPDSDPN